MIVQEFYLPKIRWKVKVFYSVTCYYLYDILDALRDAGCRGKAFEDAYRMLYECDLDTGYTYSNIRARKSVIVIATSSSAAEFNNSLQHEQRHLERQIAEFLHIDPNSEDAAYLAGDIAKAMFSHAKHLMCDECRKRL